MLRRFVLCLRTGMVYIFPRRSTFIHYFLTKNIDIFNDFCIIMFVNKV